MEEDLPIIWDYLETKIAPFIVKLFSGVQDSSSALQQPTHGIQKSVWDILTDLKQPLSKKIRGDLSRKANYRLKNRADQNNRCHENAGKFRRNIVSSEISSKSPEKPGISSKFVCITFAQYCIITCEVN